MLHVPTSMIHYFNTKCERFWPYDLLTFNVNMILLDFCFSDCFLLVTICYAIHMLSNYSIEDIFIWINIFSNRLNTVYSKFFEIILLPLRGVLPLHHREGAPVAHRVFFHQQQTFEWQSAEFVNIFTNLQPRIEQSTLADDTQVVTATAGLSSQAGDKVSGQWVVLLLLITFDLCPRLTDRTCYTHNCIRRISY
jgi:hypothetical protein